MDIDPLDTISAAYRSVYVICPTRYDFDEGEEQCYPDGYAPPRHVFESKPKAEQQLLNLTFDFLEICDEDEDVPTGYALRYFPDLFNGIKYMGMEFDDEDVLKLTSIRVLAESQPEVAFLEFIEYAKELPDWKALKLFNKANVRPYHIFRVDIED